MAEPLITLKLPQRKELEVVAVKLADGTIVARAAHEVKPKEQAQEVKP